LISSGGSLAAALRAEQLAIRELTVAVSSLGDEYYCMICDCTGRIPLTALST
jgi:hypothetical protein